MPGLVDAIAGRCGRFPTAAAGGCTWFGLIGDTNAPIEGSDWWRLFEDDKPPDWQVFRQPVRARPAGREPGVAAADADTMQMPVTDQRRRAQGRTYYERLARGKNPDWIKRYVHAEYGEDPTGTAVFRGSFKRSFHVKRRLSQ